MDHCSQGIDRWGQDEGWIDGDGVKERPMEPGRGIDQWSPEASGSM